MGNSAENLENVTLGEQGGTASTTTGGNKDLFFRKGGTFFARVELFPQGSVDKRF